MCVCVLEDQGRSDMSGFSTERLDFGVDGFGIGKKYQIEFKTKEGKFLYDKTHTLSGTI